jgi:hypothetical protein
MAQVCSKIASPHSSVPAQAALICNAGNKQTNTNEQRKISRFETIEGQRDFLARLKMLQVFSSLISNQAISFH